MATLTRKQREIQQREERILEIARTMVLEGGYIGLNMDRIAQELEYSKGTIYQHFSNKEDILVALAVSTMERRIGLFNRAVEFKGHPREKLCAIGFASRLFFERYPEFFQVEQLIRSTSLWEKTSQARQMAMQTCETACVSTVGRVIYEAIDVGDLLLPAEITPEELVFGLWSMHFGAFTILATSNHASLGQLGIVQPHDAIHHNIQMMLDGYQWRPLSTEHDYQQTLARIQAEVFPDEG
jgi:AcrR family transcriptional regulator